MNEITEIQVYTHEWMVQFMIDNHRPPTIREIAKNYGVSSKAVLDRINAMRKKGLVQKGKYAIPTGIKVVKETT